MLVYAPRGFGLRLQSFSLLLLLALGARPRRHADRSPVDEARYPRCYLLRRAKKQPYLVQGLAYAHRRSATSVNAARATKRKPTANQELTRRLRLTRASQSLVLWAKRRRSRRFDESFGRFGKDDAEQRAARGNVLRRPSRVTVWVFVPFRGVLSSVLAYVSFDPREFALTRGPSLLKVTTRIFNNDVAKEEARQKQPQTVLIEQGSLRLSGTRPERPKKTKTRFSCALT